MASGVDIAGRLRRFRGGRRLAVVVGALASASCVPALGEAPAPRSASAPPTAVFAVLDAPAPAPTFTTAPAESRVAAAIAGSAFRGLTPLDRLRAHDCLAQAIYYEAASESEDGQRAVAQVVLNRVRHPSWPNSVCGVVYQGPMRAGGGCQFTFTCDGALAVRPGGPAWARARLLAAEALAGRAYAPAGLSTHYHTHAVSPHWAPSLEKTVSLGAHQFYRLPGRWGRADAFAAAYAGAEPFPRPAMTLVRYRALGTGPASGGLAAPGLAELQAAARPALAGEPSAPPPPPTTVREEYRHSGQWRADAPAAITGR